MKRITDARIDGETFDLIVRVPRLDASNAREFKQECQEAWRPGLSAVSVDLGQVGFIDSSGIGALLSLNKRLPSSQPGIRLRRVQPTVQAVIELLRLHRIFEVEA